MKKAILSLALTVVATSAQASQKELSCSLNNGKSKSIALSDISDQMQILTQDSAFKVEVLDGDLGTTILLSSLNGQAIALTEASESQLSDNNKVSLGLSIPGKKMGYVNCEIVK